MGYMHINNLYKDIDILQFKECYALEKIHGTSANISWKDNKIRFFSGGAKHQTFVKIFDEEKLKELFNEMFKDSKVTIYGEAYGGREQGMRMTYGDELKFIVFDVMIDEYWLDVKNAEDVAKKLRLEFVDYVKIPATIEEIDKQRARPSTQAKRNGIQEDKIREGIVLRPPMEVLKNNGKRIIVKHKNDEFMETATKREVDPEKLKVLEEAQDIANEWVTEMRLSHVLDKLGNPTEIEKVRDVITAMREDVLREAEGEIIISDAVIKSIGKETAKLYKEKISKC